MQLLKRIYKRKKLIKEIDQIGLFFPIFEPLNLNLTMMSTICVYVLNILKQKVLIRSMNVSQYIQQ